MIPPKRFLGRTPVEVLVNQIIDYLASVELHESHDVRLEKSPRGTTIRVNRQSGGTAASSDAIWLP